MISYLVPLALLSRLLHFYGGVNTGTWDTVGFLLGLFDIAVLINCMYMQIIWCLLPALPIATCIPGKKDNAA